MCSLLSNFGLSVIEILLYNPELCNKDTANLINDKLERLGSWFETQTDYNSIVRKFTSLATATSSLLLASENEAELDRKAAYFNNYFTETEQHILLKKGKDDCKIAKIIDARRTQLEKAVRKIPSSGIEPETIERF